MVKVGDRVIATNSDGVTGEAIILAWTKPHPLKDEARRVRFVSHGGVSICLLRDIKPKGN